MTCSCGDDRGNETSLDATDLTLPASQHRWFRLTPDRLILALLVVEVLLWLSERFRWLPLNEHKGWTVLLAILLVVAAIMLLLLGLVISLLFRWRFQFRLRSLLIMTLAVAIVCSWITAQMREAKEQATVVEALVKEDRAGVTDVRPNPDGGFPECPNSRPVSEATPSGLRKLLGEDFFADAACVLFMGHSMNGRSFSTPPTNDQLSLLRRLPRLQFLDLWGTKVTDAQLRQLRDLPQLRWLDLSVTGITDAGLKCVGEMLQLQALDVSNTEITDAGLQHLQRLCQLQSLNLSWTWITNRELECLRTFRQLRELRIDATRITDAGLEHIEQLDQLRRLDLSYTRVTDAGLVHLERLVDLDPDWLLSQDGFTKNGPNMNDTRITREGILRLKQALSRRRGERENAPSH